MSDTAQVMDANADAEVKDLYEVGEIPPLGHMSQAKMYAWSIRRSATASRTRPCRWKPWIRRSRTATRFW